MLELSYLFYVNLQVARDTSREEKRIATHRAHKRTFHPVYRPPHHGRRSRSGSSENRSIVPTEDVIHRASHATRCAPDPAPIRSLPSTGRRLILCGSPGQACLARGALAPPHALPTANRRRPPRRACNTLNAKDLRLQDCPSHRCRIDKQNTPPRATSRRQTYERPTPIRLGLCRPTRPRMTTARPELARLASLIGEPFRGNLRFLSRRNARSARAAHGQPGAAIRPTSEFLSILPQDFLECPHEVFPRLPSASVCKASSTMEG